MFQRCYDVARYVARFTALLRSDSEQSQVASNTRLRYVLNFLSFWFLMTRKFKSHASNNCIARRVKLLKVTKTAEQLEKLSKGCCSENVQRSRVAWRAACLFWRLVGPARLLAWCMFVTKMLCWPREDLVVILISFTRSFLAGFEDALYWRCLFEISHGMLLGTYWRTSCWIPWGSGMKILKRASC